MNSSTQSCLGLASLLTLALPFAGACVFVEQPIGSLEEGESGGDGECTIREGIDFEWEAVGISGLVVGGEGVDWDCTVTEADTTNGITVTLDCPNATGPVDIYVSSTPQLGAAIAVGDVVRLRHVKIDTSGPDLPVYFMRLDKPDSGHLLTVIEADHLDPDPIFGFEMPLNLQMEAGLCMNSPMDCGGYERVALSFDLDGPKQVLDGHHASFGASPTTNIWVAEAARLDPDDECGTYPPENWFRVLIVGGGEG